MKMRWFVLLIFLADFFTAAYQKDVTTIYKKHTAYFMNFTKPVPIESDGNKVNIGALTNTQSASSVVLDEKTNSGSKHYMVMAKYAKLVLFAYCSGQRPNSILYDCSARIENFKYKVTFAKKQGKYEVVGGHGTLEDTDFKVIGYVNPATRRVTAKELGKAVDAQLVPFVAPTPLLAAIEGAINKSFRDIVLPK